MISAELEISLSMFVQGGSFEKDELLKDIELRKHKKNIWQKSPFLKEAMKTVMKIAENGLFLFKE